MFSEKNTVDGAFSKEGDFTEEDNGERSKKQFVQAEASEGGEDDSDIIPLIDDEEEGISHFQHRQHFRFSETS